MKSKKKISDDRKDKLSDNLDGINTNVNNLKKNKKDIKKEPVTKIIVNSKSMTKKEALEKANKKLGKILDKTKNKIEDIETKQLEDLNDDMTIKELLELEKKGIRVIFPNLKYAKPKYSNVSELIKYVESDKPQEGGVKIIIMNFNDQLK